MKTMPPAESALAKALRERAERIARAEEAAAGAVQRASEMPAAAEHTRPATIAKFAPPSARDGHTLASAVFDAAVSPCRSFDRKSVGETGSHFSPKRQPPFAPGIVFEAQRDVHVGPQSPFSESIMPQSFVSREELDDLVRVLRKEQVQQSDSLSIAVSAIECLQRDLHSARRGLYVLREAVIQQFGAATIDAIEREHSAGIAEVQPTPGSSIDTVDRRSERVSDVLL